MPKMRSELVAEVTLPFTAPFDAASVLRSYAVHASPDLESVEGSRYRRVLSSHAWFEVVAEQSMRLQIWDVDDARVAHITKRVRQMFGLEVDVSAINAAMKRNPVLEKVWARFPGIRIARRWSAFETVTSTILGQLVSISFGRTLTKELMNASGAPFFPTPKQVLNADLSKVRTSAARRRALIELAERFASGALKEDGSQPIGEVRKVLREVPGIGPWTTEYAAMFAFNDDDAFPASDYVLKQELKLHEGLDVSLVRPFRSYAAIALWRNFAERNAR
jgi:DNA-3-methyladenine glycosylase II